MSSSVTAATCVRSRRALRSILVATFAALVTAAAATVATAAPLAADVNCDFVVDCRDVFAVQAAFGKRAGQAGYSAAADVDGNGIVNVRDLTAVSQALAPGTRCSPLDALTLIGGRNVNMSGGRQE